MSYQQEDKVIALAAIMQIAANVSSIANNNQCNHDELMTALQSIAKQNPESTLDVFGTLENLKTGLELIIQNFSAKRVNPEVGRYMVNLTTLERQLHKSSDIAEKLHKRLQDSERQLEFYSIDSPEILKIYAGIYRDTISQLPLKIQVIGKQQYLQQEQNQNKIRSLLLAGIRCAVLWRQVGGKRRQILFSRKSLLKTAQSLLSQLH